MFLLKWFSDQREQEKKEHLCETLLKDIRIDIGDCFREEEKKRMFTVADLHIKRNTQMADLHLHLSEPMNHAQQSEWTDTMGNPLTADDERVELFYKKYFEEVDQVVKQSFFYAKDIRHFASLVLREDNRKDMNIDYYISIDMSERIFPLSRKIKKSIIKAKEYFLKR